MDRQRKLVSELPWTHERAMELKELFKKEIEDCEDVKLIKKARKLGKCQGCEKLKRMILLIEYYYEEDHHGSAP